MLRAHKHWLAVILWMGFIFVMSTELGSSAHTSRIIEPLLRWLNPQISAETIDLVHTLGRKGGHLTEYAVLALLTLRATNTSMRAGRTGGWHKAAAIALLVAAAYAATDEFHQSFVPERTASVYDVLIDTTGAVVALTAASVWRKLRRSDG